MTVLNPSLTEHSILLRPHHLICATLFSGSGYSAEFVKNMTQIKERLSASDTRVVLTRKRDDVCIVCPVRDCGKEPDNASMFDDRVQSELGVITGQEYLSGALAEMVRVKAQYLRLEELCSECSWFGELCLKPWRELGRTSEPIALPETEGNQT